MPPKREIKKSVIRYVEDATPKQLESRDRERSREKIRPSNRSEQVDREIRSEKREGNKEAVKVEEVNGLSRRERLRRAQRQEEEMSDMPMSVQVKIEEPERPKIIQQPQISAPSLPEIQEEEPVKSKIKKEQRPEKSSDQSSSQSDEQKQAKILSKPVFISKQYREPADQQSFNEQQRKRRSIKYTTKLLLQESKQANSQEENQQTDSEFQNQTDIPNDDDTINQEYEFQLWKIRELKRIRKSQEEYRKHELEKKEIQRRRQMSNQQIFIQNRALGSDATDNTHETKHVFMQKYYHKGAFFQDSDDEILKRDYNLPTPMEMQDKTGLPELLHKRIGNFGKKGQSKYKHLTAEDTSDLNPLTRPDESILQSWKRRTAGYKGSYGSNV